MKTIVEVFKTNVEQESEAKLLLQKLAKRFPACRINFDLSDCDKILRVQGSVIQPNKIIELLSRNDFKCALLD